MPKAYNMKSKINAKTGNGKGHGNHQNHSFLNGQIIEIHFKKPCFGLRRLQDGVKMDFTNALFWSVKIVRIHCKKQVLGRMNVI